MDDTYWAAEEDDKKLGNNLREKVETFEKYVRDSGLYELWAAMHRHYHGFDREGYTSHEITNKGDDGELAVFNQNFLREMLTHYRTLAQGQRAALEPIATDEDYESELQKIRAKAVLEHADTESRLEELRNEAIEYAAVYGVGTMRQCWRSKSGKLAFPADIDSLIDDNLGNPQIPEPGSNTGLNEDQTAMQMAPEPTDETAAAALDAAAMSADPSQFQQADGQPLDDASKQDFLEGELWADVFLPTDNIIDPARRNTNHPWRILRTRRNRWDLAAEYGDTPERKAKILKHSDREPYDPKSIDLRFAMLDIHVAAIRAAFQDEMEVFEFWHTRTPAMPEGRLAYFLSDGTVLEVRPLGKLRKLPIRDVAPGKILNTPFHYTPGFDLLSPQEALNMLQSIALTNERAHGVGVILMPQGSNLVAEEITTGLAICEYIGGLGEPKSMNFTATPAEVFQNQDRIQGGMQKTIGVNGTIRGDPEANLKSGSALIFVQSQAVQFASNFQNNIVRFYEATANDTIWIHQEFMSLEKTFELLGEQDAIEMLAFAKEGLNRIVRCRVEVVNPAMNTLAGRTQIADGMIAKYGPEVIPPAQYLRMLRTGNFDPVTREKEKKLANAKKMCQLLAQGIGVEPKQPKMNPMTGQPLLDPMTGQPIMESVGTPGTTYVRPLATDDHRFMIQQAITVLDSPAARNNGEVIKAVLGVVGEHIQLLSDLTLNYPAMLEATGQQPLQSAMINPGMMGMPGGLGVPGGPPQMGPNASGRGGAKPPALGPGGIDNSPPGPNQMPKMPQLPRAPGESRPGQSNLIGQRL